MKDCITVDGREFSATATLGQTVAIKGIEYRPSIPTKHGVRPAYKADVMVLSGDQEGYYFENVLFFQKDIIKKLRGLEGDNDPTLLGVLAEYPTYADPEQKYFTVDAPTATDIRLAAVYGV